jgi:hypothetical protein
MSALQLNAVGHSLQADWAVACSRFQCYAVVSAEPAVEVTVDARVEMCKEKEG